jgi:hypothetical protein
MPQLQGKMQVRCAPVLQSQNSDSPHSRQSTRRLVSGIKDILTILHLLHFPIIRVGVAPIKVNFPHNFFGLIAQVVQPGGLFQQGATLQVIFQSVLSLGTFFLSTKMQ